MQDITSPLALTKPDGTQMTRVEAEKALWEQCKTSHVMRRVAASQFGLDSRYVWGLKPTSITHWILDELIRKRVISGEQIGVNPDLESDDSYFNSYIQKLAVFVQEGRALQPKEGEGINMSDFNHQMPPPNGQNGFAPPNAFSQPPQQPQFQQQPPQQGGYAPPAPPQFNAGQSSFGPPPQPSFGPPPPAAPPQNVSPPPSFPPQGPPPPVAAPQQQGFAPPTGAPPPPPAAAPQAARRGRRASEPGTPPQQAQPQPSAQMQMQMPTMPAAPAFGAPPPVSFGNAPAPAFGQPAPSAPQQMQQPQQQGPDPDIEFLKGAVKQLSQIVASQDETLKQILRLVRGIDASTSVPIRGYWQKPLPTSGEQLSNEATFKEIGLPYPPQ